MFGRVCKYVFGITSSWKSNYYNNGDSGEDDMLRRQSHVCVPAVKKRKIIVLPKI